MTYYNLYGVMNGTDVNHCYAPYCKRMPVTKCVARENELPWGAHKMNCTIHNLTRAMPYTYTFRAVNKVGEGIDSVAAGRKALYFETPADYSAHPQNVTIVAWGARWAKFTWTYPEDDGGFPVLSYSDMPKIAHPRLKLATL